jgi:peptidoglycan/LPS O-acetylase OafA/YrhL
MSAHASDDDARGDGAEARGHGRFAALDGLRAVAAFSVALWHYQSSVPQLDARLPASLSQAVAHGNVGVEIFFVLSGFAVARSLVGTNVDARTLGRFMLRRTVRLDPPYAVTLALVVILALASPAYWPIRPTAGRVVAHLFYLQGVLGMPNLLGIFWTLALEIQLYLAFALLYAGAQRARLVRADRPGAADHRWSAVLAVSALAATAFLLAPHSAGWIVYFVPWWPVFCLGVLTERALRLPAARPWLLATVAALLASGWWRVQIGALAALATVATLCLAAGFAPVGRLLGARPLAALGLRSYSFYLLHSLVGGMAMNALAARVPHSASWDVVRLASAFAASSAAAWALYRIVEVPAQRWARRIDLRTAAVAEPRGESCEATSRETVTVRAGAKSPGRGILRRP